MCRESEIREIERGIWRNYPTFPTTFSLCPNNDGNSARGTGLCAECYEKKLAKIVGGYRALKLHNSIKSHSELLAELID